MKMPFGGSKSSPRSGGRGSVPVDRVREMTSKGFREVDVIDRLRREGYSPEEIDRALTQTLKQGVSEPMSGPAPTFPPRQQGAPGGFDMGPGGLPTMEQLSSQMQAPAQPLQPLPSMPETSLPQEYYESYPTEEYIDYIVQEKMEDMENYINQFSTRYGEIERRIETIRDQIEEISRSRVDELQQMMAKMDEFKDALEEVGTRIGSMEKAFKDTLPALIESVRALSDLVQRMKREA